MKSALLFPHIGRTLLAAALVAMAGTGSVEMPLIRTSGGTQTGGTKGYANTAGSAITGDITSAKALEFLYGKVVTLSPGEEGILGGDCMEFAPWKPPANQEKFREYLKDNEHKDKTMAVCKMLGAHYTEQGEQKFMLGTQAVYKQALDGGGLNFQPQPIIGAAIFVKRGGQWTLELEDKFIAEGSLWSKHLEATTATLQRIGPDKHGILLDEFIHLGAGCSGNSLSLLVPLGESFKAIELGSGSNCEGEGWDYSAAFDQSSTGEYYDVVVNYMTTSGKKEVKRSQRMRFQNGQYVKAAAKSGKKASAKKRK